MILTESNFSNLELNDLESINGGGLDDSSFWGSAADLASILFPKYLGRSTFLGFVDSYYLQMNNDHLNKLMNGETIYG